MPRLHILSDLHLEFGDFTPPRVEADVTVLAGDTWTRGRLFPWPDASALFGRPVIMVAGNHEFYGGAVDTMAGKLREKALCRGARLLENEEAVVGGIRILGCTLWTSFRFFAGDDMTKVRADADHCVGSRHSPRMMDFWNIRVASGGYRKFRPKDAAELHAGSVRWLRSRLSVPFDGPTVVVTHHAPSARCVPPAFASDRFTAAYASRLDALIEEFQPDAWIWGHIHESLAEFRIGRTRMVSNPRGYLPSHLNPSFDPGLVIDL